MTDEQLQHLKMVCSAATPGPWELWTSNSVRRITGPDGRDGGVLSAVPIRSGGTDLSGYNRDHDLLFIVTSRTAVPELIAEVDRLRAAIREAMPWIGVERGGPDFASDEVQRLNELDCDKAMTMCIEALGQNKEPT